jgi:site-specific recombinase XerC
MMTKKEQLQMDTLRSQLEAERKHSEQATKAYRENLYELVDCKIKLDRIRKVMEGQE